MKIAVTVYETVPDNMLLSAVFAPVELTNIGGQLYQVYTVGKDANA
jgi:hypothetical protein